MANEEVKYALVRQMRHLNDQIAQRDDAIPRLQQQLSDARGERVELIDRLTSLQKHADDNNIVITAKDIAPPVQNACNAPGFDDDDEF